MNFLKNLIVNFKKDPQTSLETTCNLDQNNIGQSVDQIDPNFEDLKDYLTSQSSDTIPDLLDATEPTGIEINIVNDINIDSDIALESNNNDAAEDNKNQETMIDLNEFSDLFDSVDYSEDDNELDFTEDRFDFNFDNDVSEENGHANEEWDIELDSFFGDFKNTKRQNDETVIDSDHQASFETAECVSNDKNKYEATETHKTEPSSINELNMLMTDFINTEISTTLRPDDEVAISNNTNKNESYGFTWSFNDFQNVFESFIASTFEDTHNYTASKYNRKKTAIQLLDEYTLNNNTELSSTIDNTMVTVQPIASSSSKYVEIPQNTYINLLPNTTESVNRQTIDITAETIGGVKLQAETEQTQVNKNNYIEKKLNTRRKSQNSTTNIIKQIDSVVNTPGDIAKNSGENNQTFNVENKNVEQDNKNYISISSSDKIKVQDITENKIDDLKIDTISISSTESVKLDSDDCDGYHSSDFEFISENEADVGIIINTTKKVYNNSKTDARTKIGSNNPKRTYNFDSQPVSSNINKNLGKHKNFEYRHDTAEEDKNVFKIPKRADKFDNQPGPSNVDTRHSKDNKIFEFSHNATKGGIKSDSNNLKQAGTSDDQAGPSNVNNIMSSSNNDFEHDRTEGKTNNDPDIPKQAETNQPGPSNQNTRNINYDYNHVIFNEPDYRPNHRIPEDDAYLNLFQGYNSPAFMGNLAFMENKSVKARTYMNIEYNGMGFDMRLHNTPEESDEFEEEAKESVRKIFLNYPTLNRKRRRRF